MISIINKALGAILIVQTKQLAFFSVNLTTPTACGLTREEIIELNVPLTDDGKCMATGSDGVAKCGFTTSAHPRGMSSLFFIYFSPYILPGTMLTFFFGEGGGWNVAFVLKLLIDSLIQLMTVTIKKCNMVLFSGKLVLLDSQWRFILMQPAPSLI